MTWGVKGLKELGMGKKRALNQVLRETKPQTRQDIIFGPGGPQLVPFWSGEQTCREVLGLAKAAA